MHKNIHKIILTMVLTLGLIVGRQSIIFAATENPTLAFLKTYTLVTAYTIQNTSTTGILTDGKSTITMGTDLFAPYITAVSSFKTSEGTISESADGSYILTDVMGTIAANTSRTILTERTFTTGTINYNIDKTLVTSDYSGLADYEKYTETDNKIEVSNPLIQAQSKLITSPIPNTYDKAFAIFKYVISSMNYNLSPTYANKGALSALTTHQGVCEDYSELFVALCRASGIPARTVTGYRNQAASAPEINLSDDGHMWAEVYLPNYGWVIAEPTETVSKGTVITDAMIASYFGEADTPAEHIAVDYRSGIGLYGNGFSWDSATSSANYNIVRGDDTELYTETGTTVNDAGTLAYAKAAVVSAELSKLPADISYATSLVNFLNDGTDKSSLSLRVTKIVPAVVAIVSTTQEMLDALNLSVIAVKTPTRDNYNAALAAEVALTPSSTKTTIQSSLATVLKIIIANETAASTKITALANATTAVVKAETSKLQSDVTSAATLINKLTAGTDKTSLTTRISAVQAFITSNIQSTAITAATASVVKAETSDLQTDVTSATNLVNQLPSNTVKTGLLSRISVVQTTINSSKQSIALATATASVVKVEASKLQADITSATSLVNALSTSTAKTALVNRISAVQAIITSNIQATALATATTAVAKAETSKLQSDVNSATALVSRILAGADKVSLTTRINAVQTAINSNSQSAALTLATSAVVKAESSDIQIDLFNAMTLIGKLPSSVAKTALVSRLAAAQVITTANFQASVIASATAAVVKAESSDTLVDIDAAANVVNELQSSSAKTGLLVRVKAVQLIVNAKQTSIAAAKAAEDVQISKAMNLTSLADSKPTNANYNTALTAVNNLATGSMKTVLETKLTVILKKVKN